MTRYDNEESDIYDRIRIKPKLDRYVPPKKTTTPIKVADTYIPKTKTVAPVPVQGLKVPLLNYNDADHGDVEDGDEYEEEVEPREMLLSERVQLMTEKLRHMDKVTHLSPSSSTNSTNDSKINIKVISNKMIFLKSVDLIQTNFDQLSPCIVTLFIKNNIDSQGGLTLHLFKLYLYAVQYFHQDYFNPNLKDQFKLILTQLIIINDNINQEFQNKFVKRTTIKDNYMNGNIIKQPIRREIIKISIPTIIYKRLNIPSSSVSES